MPPPRTRVDACPGVLAPHDAADGALARVRLPGGRVTAGQLRVLAGCAADLGDGAVHLTSRGNLQLRGLDREDPRLVARLTAAGLLPVPSHERVRNIVASPLSGIVGGIADVRGLAGLLDDALCARPALAALPGRFLFGLDDGRGDIAAEQPDLCWQAVTAGLGRLVVAGEPVDVVAPPGEAAALLLEAAEIFLTLRAEDAADAEDAAGGGAAWRAWEVPDCAARIASTLVNSVTRAVQLERRNTATRGGLPALPASRGILPTELCDPSAVRDSGAGRNAGGEGCNTDVGIPRLAGPDPASLVGPLGERALGVAPVLGELDAPALRALAAVADHVLVTPWRTLVLPEPAPGAAERLRAHGLLVGAGDPGLLLSACAGRPGCAKSRADVRADARAVLPLTRRRTHVSGCERRCGAPHGAHLDVVAAPDGRYHADGRPVPDLAAALSSSPTARPPHERPQL